MRRFFHVTTVFLLLASSGCAAGSAPVLPFTGSREAVDAYRERAANLEKQDEVQKALFWWQVLLSQRPDDKQVQEKIASLRTLSRRKAEAHYEQARQYADENNRDKARMEAVIALRYDPDHSDALALINHDHDMIRHKVRAGETLTTISRHYFHDPDKAGIIAYFNDLAADSGELSQGAVLIFPQMPVREEIAKQTPKPAATPETVALLGEAREIFKQKMYPKVVVLSEYILDKYPDNLDALLLRNESCLALGRQHLSKGEYEKAGNVLVKVTKGFPGLEGALAKLEKWKQDRAEEHYRQGVKYYINENLVSAISEWQQTLQFSPDHIRARQNIEKAREILQKLKSVK